MKTFAILCTSALLTLTAASCLSIGGGDSDHKPVTTTTVTRETNQPQPYSNPGLTQTTETRTTRTQ